MTKVLPLILLAILFLSCSAVNKEEQSRLYTKALILYEQKQFAPAVLILTDLSQKDRNNKKYLFLLGKCFYSTDNKKKALDCLKKAYRNNQSLQDINIFYARLLLEQGDKQKALTVLLKAWEFDRFNVQINSLLGDLHQKRGDIQKALFYYSNCEVSENLIINCYLKYGLLLEEAGEKEKALRILEKIKYLNKNN